MLSTRCEYATQIGALPTTAIPTLTVAQVMLLTWYEAVFTLPVYFGVWLVKERDESLAYVRESPAQALGYLLSGSILAVRVASCLRGLSG